jgi:hypothetical protein
LGISASFLSFSTLGSSISLRVAISSKNGFISDPVRISA